MPLTDNNEPVSYRNTRANLERLLNNIIEHPERRTEIEAQMDTIFGQDKAIFVLDMSGFSRITQRLGITQFLLMIHQMHLIAKPCIFENHGLLIKAEADNLFCLFDTVLEAISAGRVLIQRLNAANTLLPTERDLFVSIGIGYGHFFNIDDEDIFGNEMNLTCKLGEDIAQRGQILLTAAAHAQVGAAVLSTPLIFEDDAISISGVTLSFYRLQN